jgi:HK97 family phage portal protein
VNLFGFEIKRINPVLSAKKGFLNANFGGMIGRTPVTEESAMGLSAYWAGVRRITESVAMLPVEVFRKQNGRREIVAHPTEYLLNAEANYESISFDFTQILITSAINHGNGLAIIERDQFGTPTSLVNVTREQCEPIKYDDEIYWKVQVKEAYNETESLLVKDADMINLRGFGVDPVVGLSAIKAHKQNLGLSIAAQDYGADFYNKSARIDGFIEYAGVLKPETKEAISQQWTANYGPNGTRGTAILDAGSKYHRIGLPPEDAQFIETRKFQKNEIATILGIPSHMINEMENSTFSNIEHQSIEFVTYSIGTWIEKIEQEYRRKLLKDTEKLDHYFKHNVDRLLRTDVKTKGEYYRLMTDIGAYSINDVLELEDRNPIEGGDERYVQINRIPIQDMDNYYKKEDGEL